MICCLNPDCDRPYNSDNQQFCQTCGDTLTPLLNNRYRVLKPLARGGFACTYLATDQQQSSQSCVIKQLAYRGQGKWTQQNAPQLFHQEAQQLQALAGHAQIPQLIDYFSEDRSYYLVQELITGQDLELELKHQGPFNERKILAMLVELLPVLQFIHERHIIHGDIKPSNLIRTPEQKLVLIDFGIASVSSTRDRPHPAQVVQPPRIAGLGSPGYAAPEQMLQGRLTPASDLFSLGATCVRLLTGLEIAEIWMSQGYEWVSGWQGQLLTPLRPSLLSLIDKLLALDECQRFNAANQVLTHFQTASTQSPTPSKEKFWSKIFKKI